MTDFSLLSKHVYKVMGDTRAPSFCNCNHPRNIDINNSNTITCDCGEDVTDSMEWGWDTEAADRGIHIRDKNVVFHPVYSTGTSVIRGDHVLKRNMHHYWEFKIISCLSGTDTMFGIGTDKVNLSAHNYRFVSVLGLDDQSWGFSYRGLIQHGGKLKFYGKKFSQGCIVGIHLDLYRGTIEFYLNRRAQGKAFINIPNDVNIYPMACSTSAHTSIKLINSLSLKENLQYQSMRIITKYPQLLNELNEMPGLKNLSKEYWFLQSPEISQYTQNLQDKKTNVSLEDEAILCGIKYKKIKYYQTGKIEKQSSSEPVVTRDGQNNSDPSLSPTPSPSKIVYDNLYDIEHKTYNLSPSSNESSSEDENSLSLFNYFCDHD